MNTKILLALLLTTLAIPMKGFSSEVGDLQPIGTMGKGQRVLGGGKEALLFEHQGTGCLSHFWFGGNFKGVEDTRIRYYVDGEEVPSIDKKEKSFSAYRFHDDDPVFFQDGLRLTCRCGETEHGETEETKGYLNPPKTRYTTYTWVYQW